MSRLSKSLEPWNPFRLRRRTFTGSPTLLEIILIYKDDIIILSALSIKKPGKNLKLS